MLIPCSQNDEQMSLSSPVDSQFFRMLLEEEGNNMRELLDAEEYLVPQPNIFPRSHIDGAQSNGPSRHQSYRVSERQREKHTVEWRLCFHHMYPSKGHRRPPTKWTPSACFYLKIRSTCVEFHAVERSDFSARQYSSCCTECNTWLLDLKVKKILQLPAVSTPVPFSSSRHFLYFWFVFFWDSDGQLPSAASWFCNNLRKTRLSPWNKVKPLAQPELCWLR